jgi:hypothetical protein
MVVGDYENCNYDYQSFIPKVPNYPDRLTLMENGEFYSPHWGEGVYEINYLVSGTEIRLSYKYEYGTAGYKAVISRGWFGKPKIILVSDLDHYYKKI